MTEIPSREAPVRPTESALLLIDVQVFCADRGGGEFAGLTPKDFEARYASYFADLEGHAIPNMQRLLAACRQAGIEALYCVIESLTRDGRDRSLDYKMTGFQVPKGSPDAAVIEAVAPEGDEMVFSKTASSVFNATNIDYVLRNLGVRDLILAGLRTDHCVESAVRDACDLGYRVTLVTDACATLSRERHENSLRTIQGYCRQRTTDALLDEIHAQSS